MENQKPKTKKQRGLPAQAGYTIIETMIAVSLFVIIIVTGMGSLLSASSYHKKTVDMREVTDNLSFIIEDIGRNMRTGYSYHCFTGSETIPGTPSSTVSTPKSCETGWGIAFESDQGSTASNNDQWVYYIGADTGISGNPLAIWKSTAGGATGTFVKMNPDNVVIDGISGFSVLGAEAPTDNFQQPFAIIRLNGTITFKAVITPFFIQTSASQRYVDI